MPVATPWCTCVQHDPQFNVIYRAETSPTLRIASISSPFTGHIMFICIVLMVLSSSPLRHGYRDYMPYCTILFVVSDFYLALNVLGATGT
ncbi:uncharacterized protein HD556DRAFT_442846 [Suillus plorans]|uniref:Uncharacterized protein n=1 Tax=Suillus plorans TaxID=116603 RepID=A0A9P7DIH4_9AGAM|nr:uncharacterized protein HD556DRAFT_442846 [Suillus plorans]KAG1794175.1 hypothetical protein HD556DRAFT_442846 [Suillus plorans]